MNNDFLDPINSVDMPDQADSAIALDFLLSVKNGVRNYAYAITETATPALKQALRNQMEAALDLHEEIANLMISKGWLHPYNVRDQVEVDLKSADTAVKIANLTLFPRDTDRLGTFATPYK
ncbi:spore coat protein [Bacillus sp. T33-2]|uniref:spore coat protein n=1 Tax=Bacillus sp. T33-2 TaxID=2054168 RepID=UPI000C75F165|nr:spore coat protein [Bacillus sp. T33-2]PLR98747.1 spore coat protein [Bacillus sp. T33-2]